MAVHVCQEQGRDVTTTTRKLLVSAWLLFAACAAFAQSGRPSGDNADGVAHPWVVAPPNWSPEAYFTNIQDGAVVDAPFVARFGLSMRGIVPAGKTAGNAGHHHLLIDQDLPLDFKQPLPFTQHYIHFGKGQIEHVINLPPGKYTMRLLLADQGHIPYFVYSKPLSFTVSRQKPDVKPATVLGEPRVQILSPGDGATVQLPFRVQFHASGYNLSHVAPRVPDTGHFRLTLQRPGYKAEVIEFYGGQTEVWLKPPRGDYSARLDLVSNTEDGKVMAGAKPVNFKVP